MSRIPPDIDLDWIGLSHLPPHLIGSENPLHSAINPNPNGVWQRVDEGTIEKQNAVRRQRPFAQIHTIGVLQPHGLRWKVNRAFLHRLPRAREAQVINGFRYS